MFKKFFDQNKKDVKRLEKKAKEVEALAAEMEQLSDEELKAKTVEFKERLAKGETLDDLLVEAFAVCREAADRVLGLFPYSVQIMGSIVLHEGNIPEMKTGEGKTLTATMAVYLNALAGRGVHVVTVNEYLSSRDAKEMGALYNWLGLTVSLNSSSLTKEQKHEAYSADIMYSTNNELAFDYLRDNMVFRKEDLVQRPLFFAVIDEVDSILIDEARTPLIVSGQASQTAPLYIQSDKFVRLLEEGDYTYDEESKNPLLTESGIEKAELGFGIDNLYSSKHSTLNNAIIQSLRAHFATHLNVDYVVQDGEVVIVDNFTGRLMHGRRYAEGLHQALEAKEGLEIRNESKTLATVTFQNYFRRYEKLSGMTGTAKTEEEEFRNIYNMNVIVIPTNKPIQRVDNPDLIYPTLKAKFNGVIKDVVERHKKGQPVLIGTVAIETSEEISRLLTENNIPHEVLNAKNHANEAKIIANAGQKGAVTVATNMAGRGTDIKPGAGVLELGGLAVIGTERHDSLRIDNQLRGRSGRQGDVGVTQFYLSLEDPLMANLGSEKMKGMMELLGLDDDSPIEVKIISKAIESSQKQAEGKNYDLRKTLLQYDDVLREQREVIYNERLEVLYSENPREIVERMINKVIENAISNHLASEDGDYEGLKNYFETKFFEAEELNVEDFKGKNSDEIAEFIQQKVTEKYNKREEEMGAESMREFARLILLRAIDTNWVSHIGAMEELRQGIHLNAYAQIDPLREYQREGFILFEDTIHLINEYTANYVMKAQVQRKVEEVSSEVQENSQLVENDELTETDEIDSPENKETEEE